jgi:predicted membrane protein
MMLLLLLLLLLLGEISPELADLPKLSGIYLFNNNFTSKFAKILLYYCYTIIIYYYYCYLIVVADSAESAQLFRNKLSEECYVFI